MLRKVVIETPYAGLVETNLVYARACMSDSLKRGEAPIASHLLYTQPGILNDGIPEERALGIEAGLQWAALAEATIVYFDFGISEGMQGAIARAESEGRTVEFRSIINHSV